MKTTLAFMVWPVALAGWFRPALAAEPPGPDAKPAPIAITPAWLNQLSEELGQNHPALRAAQARARAAGLNTNAVRHWADPEFRFGGKVTSPKGTKPSEDGDLIYGLEQKLPLLGKETAARRVAEAGADLEDARSTYVLQSLRRDLAKAVLTVALAERVVEIGEQDLAWLETMAGIAEDHLRAGTGTQVDLLRIQNERARRNQQLQTDRERLDQARVAANRLLGRKLDSAWPPLRLPPQAGPLAPAGALGDRAAQRDPKLEALQREVRQAEATVEATRRSRRPDLSFGVEGRQYSGDGGFREGTFMLGLSIPWINQSGYRSDLARDRARVESAQLDVSDYGQAVREQVHQLVRQIDAARREASLDREEIIPRSEQALASAHANWQAGRGLFNDNMEARRMLLEGQLAYERAVTDQYQLLADLALLCGFEDFEAAQNFRASPETNPIRP